MKDRPHLQQNLPHCICHTAHVFKTAPLLCSVHLHRCDWPNRLLRMWSTNASAQGSVTKKRLAMKNGPVTSLLCKTFCCRIVQEAHKTHRAVS